MQKRASYTIERKPAYVKGFFVFSQKIRQKFYLNLVSRPFPLVFSYLRPFVPLAFLSVPEEMIRFAYIFARDSSASSFCYPGLAVSQTSLRRPGLAFNQTFRSVPCGKQRIKFLSFMRLYASAYLFRADPQGRSYVKISCPAVFWQSPNLFAQERANGFGPGLFLGNSRKDIRYMRRVYRIWGARWGSRVR